MKRAAGPSTSGTPARAVWRVALSDPRRSGPRAGPRARSGPRPVGATRRPGAQWAPPNRERSGDFERGPERPAWRGWSEALGGRLTHPALAGAAGAAPAAWRCWQRTGRPSRTGWPWVVWRQHPGRRLAGRSCAVVSPGGAGGAPLWDDARWGEGVGREARWCGRWRPCEGHPWPISARPGAGRRGPAEWRGAAGAGGAVARAHATHAGAGVAPSGARPGSGAGVGAGGGTGALRRAVGAGPGWRAGRGAWTTTPATWCWTRRGAGDAGRLRRHWGGLAGRRLTKYATATGGGPLAGACVTVRPPAPRARGRSARSGDVPLGPDGGGGARLRRAGGAEAGRRPGVGGRRGGRPRGAAAAGRRSDCGRWRRGRFIPSGPGPGATYRGAGRRCWRCCGARWAGEDRAQRSRGGARAGPRTLCTVCEGTRLTLRAAPQCDQGASPSRRRWPAPRGASAGGRLGACP